MFLTSRVSDLPRGELQRVRDRPGVSWQQLRKPMLDSSELRGHSWLCASVSLAATVSATASSAIGPTRLGVFLGRVRWLA